MGFFGSKDNNNSEASSKVEWTLLQSMADLDAVEKKSFERPVLIFKHSTRCSISRMALKQFELDHNIEPGKLELYFLDLLSYRSVSNEIADRYNVEHQSPQIIILKDGKSIYTTSHSDIDAEALKMFI